MNIKIIIDTIERDGVSELDTDLSLSTTTIRIVFFKKSVESNVTIQSIEAFGLKESNGGPIACQKCPAVS